MHFNSNQYLFSAYVLCVGHTPLCIFGIVYQQILLKTTFHIESVKVVK